MEPAGKLPQQELLTQNELLKQQVGQDTEPLGTSKGMHVLNLHSKEPSLCASSSWAGVSAGVLGVGDPTQHPPDIHLEGPQPWAIEPAHMPGAWNGCWTQGWQRSDGRCLPSARCTHIFPPCQVKIFEEDFQRERSDRERMNEEKEELKQQLEKLQKQLVLSNNQVSSTGCYWQHSGNPVSTP